MFYRNNIHSKAKILAGHYTTATRCAISKNRTLGYAIAITIAGAMLWIVLDSFNPMHTLEDSDAPLHPSQYTRIKLGDIGTVSIQYKPAFHEIARLSPAELASTYEIIATRDIIRLRFSCDGFTLADLVKLELKKLHTYSQLGGVVHCWHYSPYGKI